jgi:hypothetical protein
MPETVTPCQAALWFAAHGHPVFPLHSIGDAGVCTCGKADCESPGKHPFAELAPHGHKSATVDADEIRRWLKHRYWLNYGVWCATLLVIDIDPRHGGDAAWAAISGQPTRAVPHTWRVRTGGGGEHIYLQNTIGVSGGDLDKGVEIKGKGGYIVGPACLHESGKRYAWQPQCSPKDAPLAPPPAWLAGLITHRTYLGKTMAPREWVRIARERYAEGHRRSALLRIVGKLATVPGNCSQLVAELMLAWNEARCDPPLPESEVSSVVEDIFTREQVGHKWLRVVGGTDGHE